ncbi:MAG: class I SAM-dependent methyltransferase, partial [Desulfobacteraceae bacterium]|nr:class I SAM-dependent methyltransferase [Desulfobacteraceae bacterium]
GSLTELLACIIGTGTAIDLSSKAVEATKSRVSQIARVGVLKTDFFSFVPMTQYGLVLAYDVLEHIPDDAGALARIYDMLCPGGHLLVSFPVKMAEWRWDDDYYGHVRRYEQADIARLFDSGEFRIVDQLDISFPVLWVMRRLYTRFFRPRVGATNIDERTMDSAFESAAGSGFVMRLVESLPLWNLLMSSQQIFKYSRLGCNTLVLAIRQH